MTICTYCAVREATTVDHVIPKCLFTPPYPDNLITTPACLECNQAKAVDDQFLRDFLVTDFAGSQSPTAEGLLRGKLSRSVKRNRSEIGRAILAGTRNETLRTKGGVYLGDVVTAPLPHAEARFTHIFGRIIRGLLEHHAHALIPMHYPVTVLRAMPWDFDELWRSFNELHVSRCRPLGDVFDGACARPAEDPLSTAWMLTFYGRAHFAVYSFNPELSEPTC